MKQFKRTVSLLLALLMVTGCLSGLTFTAGAEETAYDLWIQGIQVTEANKEDILGNGTMSYDAATNTLLLKGVGTLSYQAEESGAAVIEATGNLTVCLQENNNTLSMADYGIHTTGKLYLTGDGRLYCYANNSGIYSEGGLYMLDVEASPKVYLYGDYYGLYAEQIHLRQGELYAWSYGNNTSGDGLSANAAVCAYDGVLELGTNQSIHNRNNVVLEATGAQSACAVYAYDGVVLSDYMQVTEPISWALSDDGKTINSGSTAAATVQISPKQARHLILDPGWNGGALISNEPEGLAYPGQTITVTAIPDEGMYLNNLFVDVIVEVGEDEIQLPFTVKNGKYSFTMPDADVQVTADFGDEPFYDVRIPEQFAHGSITTMFLRNPEGELIELTAVPEEGYELSSLSVQMVGGQSVELEGSGDTRSFTMPAGDVTVSASFAPKRYTVNVSSTGSGSVYTSNSSYAAGETVRLMVSQTAGYHLESLSVTDAGENALALTELRQFTMPASDVTVTAVFTEGYPLVIGGTRVTAANASDVLGNGKVSFNYSNKTLTLNNLVGLAQTGSKGALIEADGIDLKITGTATLQQTGSGEADYAIYAPTSNITIQGSGTEIKTNSRLGGIVASNVYFEGGIADIYVSQSGAIGVKATGENGLYLGSGISMVKLESRYGYPAEFSRLIMNGVFLYEPYGGGRSGTHFMDANRSVENVHTVVIMPSSGSYAVQTTLSSGYGSVTVDPAGSIAPGTSVTLTYTPTSSGDSWVDSLSLTYDRGSVPFEALGNGQFRFVMPAWNVYANLHEIANDGEYNVTLVTNGDGTLTSDVSSAKIYDTVTISAVPNRYSKLSGFLVTGASDGTVVSVTVVDENTYTFRMPKGGVKVEAYFDKIKYPVVFETNGYDGPTDEPFYWLEDRDYNKVENSITMPQSDYLYVCVDTPSGYNCYYDNLFWVSGGTAQISGGFSGSAHNARLFKMTEVTDDHITITILCERQQSTTVSYPVWIGDTQVTNRNMNDVFRNGQWRYDPDTQTLYGENPGALPFYSITSSNNTAIKASGIDLTVVCNGSLHGTNGASMYYGIVVENGDLTLKGNLSMEGIRTNGLVANNITIAGGSFRVATNFYIGQRAVLCRNGGTLRVSNTVDRFDVYGRTAAVEAGALYYGSDLVMTQPANGGSIQNGTFCHPNGNTSAVLTLEKRTTYAVSSSPDSLATLSVSPNANSVSPGTAASFTVTPNAGYMVAEVSAVDSMGDPVALSESNGTYSFTMPASNVTVYVSCIQNTFQITIDPAIEHGTLTPSVSSADVGDTVTLSATPNDGYALEAFYAETADGTPIEVTDNSFIMPRSDVVVSVSFYPLGYTVTDAGTAHGRVKPDRSVASVGQTVTLTPVPETGYALASMYAVTEDGVKLELTDNTFTMPAANVLLHALFVPEGEENAAYDLWLGGTQVTAANALDIYGDGQASYDPDTQTLTLNSFSGTIGTHYAGNRHYSIYAGLDLTIVGSGNLANIEQGINTSLYGIGAPNNTLTLNGDFRLVTGISIAANVKGLTIAGGNISLSKGSLTGALEIGSGGLTILNGTERFEVRHNNSLDNNSPIIKVSGGNVTIGDDLQMTTPEDGSISDKVYNADGSVYGGNNVVIERRSDFGVRTSGIEHGTVTPDRARANEGDTVTLTYAADEGYVFDSVTVTDKNGTLIPVSAELTFTMPACEVFVSAVFSPIDYTVTVSPAEHGSILVIPAGPWHVGDSVTLVPKPDLGWELETLTAELTADPAAAIELTEQADGSYTFTMPAANVTVAESFLLGNYPITVEQTANGTVTASAASALYGERIQLTVTPDTGCELTTLTVTDSKGRSVEVAADNSFTMPAAGVTVRAEFVFHDYTLTVEPAEHGSVLAADTAHYGQEVELTVQPEPGYTLQSLTFTPEGGSETEVENNRFTMPTANVTVRAVFVLADHPITVTGASHATVTVPETAHYQDVITLVVTPDPGYRLDSITVSDAQGEIPLTEDSFTMPNNGVTVALQVSAIDYTIAVLPMDNGSITPSAPVAHVDDEITFNIDPEPGYRLNQIRVFDFSFNSYPASETGFTMPPANVLVVASFIRGYNVITDVTGHGTVAVSQSACTGGERITYTVTPDEGWELESLTILDANNEPVPGGSGYFTMPTSNVTLTAVFKGIDYHVTLADAEHGTLAGPSTANAGDEISLTVTPDEGWELETLTVQDANGNEITVSSAYTFTMPASGVTVTATFRGIDYTVTVGEIQHGTVTADKLTAHVGETVTLTAAPEDGYALSAYTVTYGDNQRVPVENGQFTMPAADVTVTATFSEAVGYIDALGNPMTPVTDYMLLRSNTTELTEGWWVVSGNITNSNRLTVSGSVNLILCDGATLNATRGIAVGGGGNSLTVWAQSHGDSRGRLIAKAENNNAAIGSNQLGVGIIVINGGEINATGGKYGAGIGGGLYSTGGSITINNGKITATGGTNAAGIGGGSTDWGGHYGNLETITITGGEVAATGNGCGAGIGGGGTTTNNAGAGNVNTIMITGGQITASSPNGYGIGPGVNSKSEKNNGLVGDVITFGWTEETDFIQSSKNVSPEKLRFAAGKAFLIDGETPVSATTDNIQDACKLIPNLNPVFEPHSVTVDDGITNGTVVSDVQTAVSGDTVTLTVTPDDGYALKTLTVRDTKGIPVAVSPAYTFAMPDADVTVTATFTVIEYSVTVAQLQNGTVTADKETASAGTTVTLTVTPNAGYELAALTCTYGENQPIPVENNQFTMPAADVTVTATFTAVDYTVTVGQVQNGTVTADRETAQIGETVTLTAAPSEGYEFTGFTVTWGDSQTVPVENGQFTMPAANVTVTATFTSIEYTVTVAKMQNGTVTADKETASAGTTVTLTVAPNAGYELASLTCTYGENQPIPVENNQFTMPAANVTVTATFTAVDYTVTVGQVQNGTVTADRETAQIGETVTLTAAPSEGYVLAAYTVTYGDGQTVPVENDRFIMPAANVTVTATFEAAVPYVDARGSQMAPVRTYSSVSAGTAELSEGWWVVSGSITNNNRLTVSGSVNLILCDGATLNATYGIAVGGGSSLTIWAQSHGDARGKLIARGSSAYNAAIGSNQLSVGTIVINGGEINATGAFQGAGIGGGRCSTGGSITINNGKVTATGGSDAAGIGGGGTSWADHYGSLDTITITGGEVSATGKGCAAGIGGGGATSGGAGAGNVNTITITGGKVTATSPNGYGIGPGVNSVSVGYNGLVNGCITFGWTEETDFIQSSKNVSAEKLAFVDGKAFLIDGQDLVATTDNIQDACKLIPLVSKTYSVIIDSSMKHGAVTSDVQTAADGETVTLTVTPEEGYELESLAATDANGSPVTLTEAEAGTYTFPMPASNVTVTATFKTAAPVTYTYFVGQSLTLQGDIGVNFYVKLNDVDPADARVVFTWGSGSKAKEETVSISALTADTSGLYKLTVRVAAAQMTDTITAKLYSGETEVAVKQYSVAQYARYILGASDETVLALVRADATKAENLRELCKAMLIYGAKSQLQFKYQVYALADQGLSYTLDPVGELGTTVFPEDFETTTGLKYSGSSLVLESQTTYRLFFTVTDQAKFDSLTVKLGADTLSYGTRGSYVYYDIANIPAANVLKDFTLTFGEITVTANAGEYMTKVFSGSDQTLQDAMTALYWYNMAAKNFFGAS